MKRNRLLYFVGSCLVAALGMASRRYASAEPAFLARYAGDALWAVMVFGVVGLLARQWSSSRVALATLMMAYAIEGSQLYHASWIDTIRNTRVGGLALGYGFLWSDIICYTAGVALCAGLEQVAGMQGASLHGHRRTRPS